MKKLFLVIGIVAHLVLANIGEAATINWTNTAGGNWSDAANWDPNQVPGSSDTAAINLSGTYTVNLDAGVALGGFYLGGTSGTQTIAIGDPNVYLYVNGGSTVDSNGVVNVAGMLDGGPITLNGRVNCFDGAIGPDCKLNIGGNGFLYVTNSGGGYMGGAISNAGVIAVDGGSWRFVGASVGSGLIENLPGGTITLSNNVFVDVSTENTTHPVFINNQGTVRCLGRSAAINVPFNNSGVFSAEAGVVCFGAGGKNIGTFTASSGAVISFENSFEMSGNLGGDGAYALMDGLFTWTGSLSSSLKWTGGQISAASVVTVSSNGLLTVDPGPGMECDMIGTLTNDGIIEIKSGALSCTVGAAWDDGEGLLINQAGGIVDFTSDSTLDLHTDGGGHPRCINFGTLRKSGGTGVTSINPPVVNNGVIDAASGTMEFNSTQIDLASGVLNFGISALDSYGRMSFSQGVTLGGELRATLKNGYVPGASNSFQVINYGYGDAGIFTTTNLPVTETWAVDYGQPYLTLIVLNSRSIPALTLTALGMTNGIFSVQTAGASGADYILSATTDFTHWTDVSTNSAGTGPMVLADPGASNQTTRFYRVRLAP